MADTEHGLPIIPGAVPEQPSGVPNTGRVSTVMAGASREAGIEPEQFLDSLAAKIAMRNGHHKKTFAGLHKGEWTKFLLGLVIVVGGGMLAWYTAINKQIEDRPTVIETKEIVKEKLETHSVVPHPATNVRLEKVEQKVSKIHDFTIKQEVYNSNQTEILKDIRRATRR